MMISDNFCNGQPWAIRLDGYADQLARNPLTLAIVPVKEGASISVDASMAVRMEHVDGISTCIHSLMLEYIDEMELRLESGKAATSDSRATGTSLFFAVS